MQYVFLYSSILFNILTNVGFKLSALNEGKPLKQWGWLAIGLVFGLINSVLFTECLKNIALQTASAIFFSLTIVGLFLFSHFYFNESVSISRLAGVLLISVGVVLVSLK